MIVNSVCQLDWGKGCRKSWKKKTLFRVHLWGCFWERLAFESEDLGKKTLAQVSFYHIIFQEFSLLLYLSHLSTGARTSVFSCLWVLGYQSSWFSSLWHWDLYQSPPCFLGFCMQTESYSHLSGSPAGKWQIMGLLGLHNHGESTLILNLLLISLSTYILLALFLWMISRGKRERPDEQVCERWGPTDCGFSRQWVFSCSELCTLGLIHSLPRLHWH